MQHNWVCKSANMLYHSQQMGAVLMPSPFDLVVADGF
jgi:hypothetical protein